MDGVLVVDKPGGMTSHDVVAVARRALGTSRVGHTGTLDPLATGVLPLAIGRATRLVRFLMSSDKEYDATIRFGLTTDSYDITGMETGRTGQTPDREQVLAALRALTGTYLQTPPAFSAKKVGGRRAYSLARAGRRTGRTAVDPADAPADSAAPVELTPVAVTVTRAALVSFEGASARVALTCSAGFYVRAFAHAVGIRVGTGACLEALRRTRSGEFSLESAVTLEDLQLRRDAAAERIVPLERLLAGFPAARLTPEGRDRVANGREIDARHVVEGDRAGLFGPAGESSTVERWVRLFDGYGRLVALAREATRPDALHPAVVLLYN
jgi:tRNA pseudouridine55 synthase